MADNILKDESKIVERCVAMRWAGTRNVLEIRAMLGGEVDSSSVYRALVVDPRFEQVSMKGGTLVLFRFAKGSQ